MNRGFVTTSYVTVICHRCGTSYSADSKGPQRFPTVAQALDYFCNGHVITGWAINADTVTCTACVSRAVCARDGHDWSGLRWVPWTGVWGVLFRDRHCRECGIWESEAQS